jgi:DnaJ-class molecular chaperone
MTDPTPRTEQKPFCCQTCGGNSITTMQITFLTGGSRTHTFCSDCKTDYVIDEKTGVLVPKDDD